MLVKAKETGFYGGILRYEGEEPFEITDASELGRWMVPCNEDKSLESMKAGELITFAVDHNLDIGGLVPQSGKEKILAAVKTALEAQG